MNEKACALLDHLNGKLQLKNDAALSRVTGIAPPIFSKMRNGKLPVGPTFLIVAHEISCIPIAELKAIAGLSGRTAIAV